MRRDIGRVWCAWGIRKSGKPGFTPLSWLQQKLLFRFSFFFIFIFFFSVLFFSLSKTVFWCTTVELLMYILEHQVMLGEGDVYLKGDPDKENINTQPRTSFVCEVMSCLLELSGLAQCWPVFCVWNWTMLQSVCTVSYSDKKLEVQGSHIYPTLCTFSSGIHNFPVIEAKTRLWPYICVLLALE